MFPDKQISIIYKEVFNIDCIDFKLYFNKNIITTNKQYIIEFLGLCSKEYKRGFKINIDIYEYIKGSHYFNSEFFKYDKDFYNYLSKHPKQNQFELDAYIKFKIKKEDLSNNIERSNFKEESEFYITSLSNAKRMNILNVKHQLDNNKLITTLIKFFEKIK